MTMENWMTLKASHSQQSEQPELDRTTKRGRYISSEIIQMMKTSTSNKRSELRREISKENRR